MEGDNKMFRFFLAGVLLLAAPLCASAHGVLESLKGDVTIANDPVPQGRRLIAPSTVTTGAGAQASLKFDDGTHIVLGENSLLRVLDYRYQPQTGSASGDRAVFELLRGSARVVTGKIVVNNPKEFHFRTPHTELSVERGADFQVALVNPAYIHVNAGTVFSNMTGGFWRAHRTPLMTGWVSQSLDGRQVVSKLMGDFKECDVGTLRITVFPNFWQHASGDHAVATRITPVAADRCRIDVWWVVDRDAVEGRDYDLPTLMPFWERTSVQDWFICEENQAGVSSSRYRPGPYGRNLEVNVAHFVDWYLGEMSPRRTPPLRVVGT